MFGSGRSKRVRGVSNASPTLPPIITAGAYSALDAVGDKIVFKNVAANRNDAVLFKVTFIDNAQVKAALKLFLFDRDFTAVADNAAFAISDADMLNCIAIIPTGTYIDVAATSSIYEYSFSVPLQFRPAGTHIYGQLRCDATPTYTATDGLEVKLSLVEMF